MKRKFTKDLLQALANGEIKDTSIVEVEERRLVSSRDGGENWELIFEYKVGKNPAYYLVEYSVGMGLAPFQFAPDEIECDEVIPFTVVCYERKHE